MAIDPSDTSDLRLPDELQFVAEQLIEDANYLGQTFPVNAPRNWRRAFAAAVAQQSSVPRANARQAVVGESNASPRLFGAVAAAAAVVVVFAGWRTWNTQESPPRGAIPSTVRDSRTQSQGHVVPAGILPGLGSLFPSDAPRRSSFAVPMGADYFNTMFSGPEQEAVIDVLIENQIPEPSVRY